MRQGNERKKLSEENESKKKVKEQKSEHKWTGYISGNLHKVEKVG